MCVCVHTLICRSLDPVTMTSGPRTSDWTVPLWPTSRLAQDILMEGCKGEGLVRREGTEGETKSRAEVRMSGKERGGTTIRRDITSNSPHPPTH